MLILLCDIYDDNECKLFLYTIQVLLIQVVKVSSLPISAIYDILYIASSIF